MTLKTKLSASAAVALLFIIQARCQVVVNRTALSSLSPNPPLAQTRCVRVCPPGFKCQLRPGYWVCRRTRRMCLRFEQVCERYLPPTPTPTARPPSCQDLRCGALQTCVYRQYACFAPPCHPQPVCISNRCAGVRCAAGTVCVTQEIAGSNPTCADFPACRYSFDCVPLVRPKPGFCPPPERVSPEPKDLNTAYTNRCDYDNRCPADLICCPVSPRGEFNCTAPAYPDPCENRKCPLYAPTCTQVGCRDRVCRPGGIWCKDGRQCYCSRLGQVTCSDVPAYAGCL